MARETVNSKAYKEYTDALNNASLLAQKEIVDALEKIDLDRPRTSRQAIINTSIAIISKYSDMAALAAAEYYEKERVDAIGGDYQASIADPIPPEQIEKAVRYAMGYLFGGDDEVQQTGVRKLFDGTSG